MNNKKKKDKEVIRDEIDLEKFVCIDCTEDLESDLKLIEGIYNAEIDFFAKKVKVTYDKTKVSKEEIESKISSKGYHTHESGERREKYTTLLSGLALTLGLLLEFVFVEKILLYENFLGYPLYVHTAVMIFGAAVGGYYTAKRGVAAIFSKRLNVNTLITIAAIGAVIIGAVAEANAVVFLYAIADLLEDMSLDKTRKAIQELMSKIPNTAIVEENGKRVEKRVEEIIPGEIVIVRQGDKISVDGLIISGETTVNESHITGESVPVYKKVGDNVFAGSINIEAPIKIKVTKAFKNSTIQKIVSLIEEAEKRKGKTEKFIDKFASYYTPGVIALAILIAVVPIVFFGGDPTTWILRSLTVLVISCPCALTLSTPISIVSGITTFARNGVVVKGGIYVEGLSKVKAVAFDKTGTLTEGKLEIMDVIPFNGYSSEDLLKFARTLEEYSNHPIAEAIISHTERLGIPKLEISKVTPVTGKGVIGLIKEKEIYIGNLSLHELHEHPELSPDLLNKLWSEGKTAVIVCDKERVIGIITLRDKIRKDAKLAIKELKKRNVHVLMLTGDNPFVARAIAAELGLDEYFAKLLPEEKQKVIEDLVAKYNSVAMVGDGINDAPALARANIGITLSGGSTDVALETADIAIMDNKLIKIPYAIDLSKSTMKIIKENVISSFVIKSTLGALAPLGIITLWMAVGFGDVGLSLAVILNAFRLIKRRFR
ncbi:MAG: cation-translocating P-type ATPase [Candidatus Odinarchaeota archaeon]|nr:cation-translocating P-type ATPase [Candidatus Odinarchaeota archaeon]